MGPLPHDAPADGRSTGRGIVEVPAGVAYAEGEQDLRDPLEQGHEPAKNRIRYARCRKAYTRSDPDTQKASRISRTPAIRLIHQNGFTARDAMERAISNEPYRMNTRPKTDASAKNVLTGRMSPHSPPSRKMTAMMICQTFHPPGTKAATAASLIPAAMRMMPMSTPTVVTDVWLSRSTNQATISQATPVMR